MIGQGPMEPTPDQLDQAIVNIVEGEGNEALAKSLRLSVKALELLALKRQEQKTEQLLLGDW